jgi:hypothetical protein
VFPTPETVRAATVLPYRPLRVEQEGTRPQHLKVLVAQLLGPFRPVSAPIELVSIREADRLPESDSERLVA